MTNPLITRRTASLGVLLTIVSIGRVANSATGVDVAPANSTQPIPSPDLDLKWGEDGTRSSLADSLTSFFGDTTGPFMDLSQEQSSTARVQPNGEYRLADQFRIPLMGVAMERVEPSNGHHIYPAFINHNPITRIFLLTDDNKNIIAAAYADNMLVRKDGEIIGLVPRITLFYRTLEPPKELLDTSVEQMKSYYKAYGPDTSRLGYDIHVFTQRLPPINSGLN